MVSLVKMSKCSRFRKVVQTMQLYWRSRFERLTKTSKLWERQVNISCRCFEITCFMMFTPLTESTAVSTLFVTSGTVLILPLTLYLDKELIRCAPESSSRSSSLKSASSSSCPSSSAKFWEFNSGSIFRELYILETDWVQSKLFSCFTCYLSFYISSIASSLGLCKRLMPLYFYRPKMLSFWGW